MLSSFIFKIVKICIILKLSECVWAVVLINVLEMSDTYDNCDLSQQFLNHGLLLWLLG